MDDYELERIGSDSPAQSVPAAQRISPSRQRSDGNIKTTAKRSEDTQKTETSDANLIKSDVIGPAGQPWDLQLLESQVVAAPAPASKAAMVATTEEDCKDKKLDAFNERFADNFDDINWSKLRRYGKPKRILMGKKS
ncbi:hypothetical protein BU25DRAFT_490397 [Macroventuria anomochaeta]|uniref:Uncharacterized protein n=1 Tax=Macroventuria anomochaeta TaxID=301207 RepID=A0ACB6S3B9_9PLEO|nr:uncharacterized protein BU25DRAFT_490397 [Macroventuria anomochaeta]KAF2628775.1 hypothetical protein BU25DRAFT_490397 [Macroventuria anomochaeta]